MMAGASLHCLLLIEENQAAVVEQIKVIQDKLKGLLAFQQIRSRYELIMFEWILFSIEGISWQIGIQLQEVIEELKTPVIFIGSSGSGLSDLNQLTRGKFDSYLSNLLQEPDRLEEFVVNFMPFTRILDYTLEIWKQKLYELDNITDIEELISLLTYSPLISLLEERIRTLSPVTDDSQTSLDQYF